LGLEKQRKKNVSDLPLHCKPMRTVDLDKVAALKSFDPNVLQEFMHSRGWITDPGMYKAVLPPRRVLRAKLKTGHISEMQRKGKCEIASGKPRSTCRVFGVDEVLKGRQRMIEHPADINDATPEVARVKFLSGEARTRAVLAGGTVLDLDFSAWFDQFGLPAELRPWFMFAAAAAFGNQWCDPWDFATASQSPTIHRRRVRSW
jgi:hypothetical protein